MNEFTGWSRGWTVTAAGDTVIPHAGAAALRLTADRTGLTTALSRVLRRDGFTPGYDRGRVLADTAVMMPKRCAVAQWRPRRAACCHELIGRLVGLERADPPLRLRSHQLTSELIEASPLDDRAYKHRENLIDAVICAWTAALWHRHGLPRCQVLGLPKPDGTPAATIIAPAVDGQRCTR